MCYNTHMTTKTSFVRARIEPSVKKKAETVLHKIGISPSEAINVFYRRIATDKGIPFSLNIPNAETRKAIANAKSGENLKSYSSAEAMFTDILGKNWRAHV
ncbi:MAG TPA: type II toxin-antitoxin system antitoxin, RelB/DinJ family [Candidatus Yonathbacteria bacterium]|nr:type II toxin-antitoxin system antitoxin, RelB/DinJ family [Candidatus Yonathbacteria bacterium]